MRFRKCEVLVISVMLIGCSPSVTETVTETAETEITTQMETGTVPLAAGTPTDVAFGKPCIYVRPDVSYEELLCEKGIVQEDWEYPEDGWQAQQVDDLVYIHQVYTKDGILLLPNTYGSNTHKIIGIDATEPECETCEEESGEVEESAED